MKKFVIDAWEKHKNDLRENFRKDPNIWREWYKDIVTTIYQTLFPKQLDLNHIIEIDDGDYQGSLLFVVPFNKYQPAPYEYLTTWVSYGSCSGCDTLIYIKEKCPWGGTDKEISKETLDELMRLALDIARNTRLFRDNPYDSKWNEETEY